MIVKKPEITKIVYTLLHKMLSVIPLTIILEVNKVEHPATTKTKIEMIVNVLYFITIHVNEKDSTITTETNKATIF